MGAVSLRSEEKGEVVLRKEEGVLMLLVAGGEYLICVAGEIALGTSLEGS